jgi:putative endonuclease
VGLRRGRAGEKAAERELKKRRMVLLERNLRVAGAEIDLVALDGRTFVFVEVKARSASSRTKPEEAVDRAKRRNVVRGARAFLKGKGLLSEPRRYDVAAVELDARGKPVAVRWTEGAFDERDS